MESLPVLKNLSRVVREIPTAIGVIVGVSFALSLISVSVLLDIPFIRELASGNEIVIISTAVTMLMGVVLSVGVRYIAAARKMRLRQQRLAFEVEASARLMDGLFPEGKTFQRPGIYVVHQRRRASTISGDFYNFVPRGDGSLGIYFVDVEGHGLSASEQARSLYQAVTSDKDWGLGDARRELERLDDLVSRGAIFQKEQAAFCMNFTEIDPEKMEIRHGNAGMPYPLLFRAGEAQPEVLKAGGIYVGAGYSRYPVKLADVKYGDGDLLVIFSDGILEARDYHGRIFGQNGITAAVIRARHQTPEEVAEEILRAVSRHTGQEQPEDDQAVVIVQLGQPLGGMRPYRVKTLEQQDSWLFRLLNAGDTGAACHDELQAQLKTWARGVGFEDRRIAQLWAATWEAIQNAVKYGSRPGDVIYIRFVRPPEEQVLEVEVRQPALWEDWDRFLSERVKRELLQTKRIRIGGTVIMLWLSTEVHVTDLGRRISLRFAPKIVADREVVSPAVAI